MAVALVDVWHTKTGERTQLPEKSLKYWPDYTTEKPEAAEMVQPQAPTGEQAAERAEGSTPEQPVDNTPHFDHAED